jgi:hypothetical protein
VDAADGTLDLPVPADLDTTASIKSISIKGIKGQTSCFFNSNIAAGKITSASIVYPEYNNSGVPFGVTTYSGISSLKIKDQWETRSWKKLVQPTTLSSLGNDMQFRVD